MSNSSVLAERAMHGFKATLPLIITELVTIARSLGLKVEVEELGTKHIVADITIPQRRPPSPQTHRLTLESQEWEITYVLNQLRQLVD